MSDNTDKIKKKVLEALELAHGIVSSACPAAGISRETFYKWKREDPEFARQIEEVSESAIDFVEGKLFEKINGIEVQTFNAKGEPAIYTQPPSDTAIIFYLKTKAKKRGYVERTEVIPMDPNGNAIQPVINIQVVNPKEE